MTATEPLSLCVDRLNILCTASKVRGPITCRACRGTGKDPRNVWKPCPDCRGASKRAPRDGDDWKDSANQWDVILHYEGRSLSVPYWTGTGIKNTPDARSIIGSLVSDANLAANTFADFCADMGLDTDSRKAWALYEACQQSGTDLRALVGGQQYAALLNAENDL